MFNQLTAPQVVAAIGETARSVARERSAGDPLSDFERDQLMSMYSATRHLKVELTDYAPELRRFNTELAAAVGADDSSPEADRLRQAIEAGGDAASVGNALSDLLAVWRKTDEPGVRQRRATVHRLLRELADREVELLAKGLG